jgi:hypothetical protein
MENISDDDGDDILRTTVAAVAVTVIASVCATEVILKKGKRKVWVKRLFQRRQSKGSYEMLLRELKDEDPDSFRSYLRMDIDSFDHLLNLLKPHISGSERYRKPIPARERLAVTLRYLATGNKNHYFL